VAVTILAGGFVAGTHAGFDYNSFPLMDGQFVPDGYARLTPFLRNLTENIAAVQFDHRALATVTALLTAFTVALGLVMPLPPAVRLKLAALGLTTAVQYGLGVATLLLVVPAGLAAAHQANAVLVLTAALVLLHALRRPQPVMAEA
jgi:cytochrome c oxidase assembly protein subunit 15